MHTTLQPSRPLGRGLNRLGRTLAGTLLGASLAALAPTSAAQAQTVYGLGTVAVFNPLVGLPVSSQLIGSLNVATGTINLGATVPVSGVTAGQTLVGMDYRPNFGTLLALGYDYSNGNSQLYTLNPATGVATAINATPVVLALGGAGERIGFDFNPTVDRIRVVSTNDVNYRLNPNNGAIAATDGSLAYAGGTPANPGVGAVAYTNSYIGSTSTTLYDVDELNGLLAVQNPPNNGVLAAAPAPVAITLNGASFGSPSAIDVDIYSAGGANTAYLIEVTAAGSSNFYTLNLTTGAATSPGASNVVPASSGVEVRDIAALIAAPAPGALTGQLVYGVAGGNLVTFDSSNPSVIRSAVNITGLPTTPAGYALAGADFRPTTGGGELFVLSYNPNINATATLAGTNNTQLYTVNLATGALTAVGPGLELLLGGTADRIGFDFNPTVDRIRVVSTNNKNYRLNPTTGGIAATDPDVTNTTTGTDMALSAVGYTNNDNNASSGTTLYGYDQVSNQFLRSTDANAGLYVNVGASGITANQAGGVDMDVYTDNTTGANTAYAIASPSVAATAFDNLYTVNTGTGLFTLVGPIGTGTNLTAAAVFLTPAATANVLTWTGLVSSDYATAGNYNPQAAPTATSNVLVPGGTPNQPTVSTTAAALNLTVNTGGTLTTAAGGTLTVSGNVSNAGTIGGTGTGTVVLAGATAQTISGTGTTRFRNLGINNATGVSLGGPVGVSGALRLMAGALTTTGQTLTILSDATGTGLVAQLGGSLTGSLTVQRYISGNLNSGNGYRHFASPVVGDNAGTLATTGFVPSFNTTYNSATAARSVQPFPTVFGYDQGRIVTSPATDLTDFDKGFVVPAASDVMTPGTGYTVNLAGGLTPDFAGTLQTGTVTKGGLLRGPSADAGWQFLGNPFAAPYNWQGVIGAGGLTNVDNALYVFKSSGPYVGTYASYISGVGANGGTSTLPVAQAFYVRVSATGLTGSVTMAPANQLTADDGTLFQRGAADTRPQLYLTLRNASAANQLAVYFDAAATSAFDRQHDAVALPATNGLALASEVGTEALAINGLPALTGADVLVRLRLSAPAGQYTLAVDELANLPAGYHAYLRDALTGTYTDLASTPTVALSIAANAPAAGRYALLFSTQAVALATAPAALAQLVSVYPNPAHGTAAVLLPSALRGNAATAVQVLDNLGRVVLTRTLAAGSAETLTLPLTTLAPGVYSVQAHTAAGLVAKRLIVQ